MKTALHLRQDEGLACVSRTPWISEFRSLEFTCWFPVADVTSCKITTPQLSRHPSIASAMLLLVFSLALEKCVTT